MRNKTLYSVRSLSGSSISKKIHSYKVYSYSDFHFSNYLAPKFWEVEYIYVLSTHESLGDFALHSDENVALLVVIFLS